MTKRKMFLRMITASLLRRRSRMLVALLSIAIGAAILSGLVTIYYDVPRQMGAQFRNYGANMLLASSGEERMSMAAAQAALESIPEDKILGATPYRYVTVQMTRNQLSFVTGSRQILLGKEVAETIGAKVNSVIELSYRPAETASAGSEIIPGVLLTGSAVGFNNNPVYVTLKVDEDLRITELTVNADTQTPEYGGQCAEPFFTQRFIGKQIPVTLNEDVDAVTGATMTSQAVAAAETPAAAGSSLNMTVAGILDTGGKEESYIFMSQEDLTALTGEQDQIDVMELSVSASSDELTEYIDAINGNQKDVTARLVKRITNSETAVLSSRASYSWLRRSSSC